jgi:hypothetical protein
MKIKVFVHLNDMPGAFELMSEQLTRASESGLLEAADQVVLCTNGNENSFAAAREVMAEFENVSFVHTSDDYSTYEYPTLSHLKQICDESDEEFYVCYFHLKGLTKRDNVNVQDWREYMEHWQIDRWQDHVAALDTGSDTAGCNYIENPWPHYSGNFWWGRASYIRKLDPLVDPRMIEWGNPSRYIDAVLDGGNFRYEHEAWIGSKNPVWSELHSTPGKATPGWHFTNPYPRENYVIDPSNTED